MKKLDISKYYPPGYDRRKWNTFAIMALVALAFAVLVSYSGRFEQAYNMLHWNLNHTEIISGSVKMQPFAQILKGIFTAFWVFAAYCVLWGVMMRSYFTQYSNSIYIMKRLESRRELVRRCVSAPAVLLLAGFLLCLAEMLLMRANYVAKIPAMCIDPMEHAPSLAEYLRAFIP